jgi:hypothetical protein
VKIELFRSVSRDTKRMYSALGNALASGLLLVSACGSPNLAEDSGVAAPTCDTPEQGCSCERPGEVIDCGKTKRLMVDRAICEMGERTCLADNTWSECSDDRTTVVPLRDPDSSQEIQELGTFGQCPAGFDPCDVNCYITSDSAGGFSAGPGFKNDTSGVTLDGTAHLNCTSLTLTPSTSTVTLSGSSMSSLSAAPVTFTLTAAPSGCVGSTFATTWIVDHFDRASISGTNNTNGSLTVAVPIAGTMTVTALAAGISASANIDVKVNVLEVPPNSGAATPNQAAVAARATVFGPLGSPAAGSGSSSATWLYPYSGTYFPLALPAPVVQYLYTPVSGDSTTAASTVKLSLRFPAGSTAASAKFNYSLIVNEWNSTTCTAKPSACNYLDPQITIPQTAWRYFELSARGTNATLVVQRLRERSSGGPTLELETTRDIRFVDGQLKGTVYYNSYTSPQAGNTGAILAIQPGATSPTLAISPSTGGSKDCIGCHSVNSTGTQVITGSIPAGSWSLDNSKRYNMTAGTPPSPATLSTYTDNKFNYGAVWLDGVYYMTHGGGVEQQSPTATVVSYFYKPASPAMATTVTNWPSDAQAHLPRFSPDGKKLAFSYVGGSTLPCSSSAASPCTGSPKKLASDSTMKRLVVTDFSCSSPPCTSASTGFSVSNARDVTPGVTDKVARPTFAPLGDFIAYQRQIRSSKTTLAWTNSDTNSIAGALAEIWGSPVPADGSTAAVPTRLNWLNGLDGSGTSYLPQRARVVVDNTKPLYNFPITYYGLAQTGGAGPAVTLSGTATGTWNLKLDITTAGARGTAKFTYSTDGGSSYSSTTYTTGATVALGSTGLKALFPTGTYNASSIYSIRTGNVRIKGTPTAASAQDVRIKIDTTGNRGTAKFKYSTDAGATYSSSALTTAATVALGTTGLTAEFDSVNYESTSWVWGALVGHYHQDGASYSISKADDCSTNAIVGATNDNQLNYYPAFAPALVGNMAFLVFGARRMYGSVAIDDAWDPMPTTSCASGAIPARKLWVAAVDPTAPAGTDPSKPAFYLPGQETMAGNSEAYWIGAACTAVDGSCETDDDCCGGTGSSATNQCRVLNASVFPPTKACKARSSCSAVGQSCATAGDCCTGLLCPSGGGLCYQDPPLVFETQTMTRTYTAACPSGTLPAWRFFEWQATIPSGTSIEVFSQTRDSSSEAWEPGAPLLVATMSTTSAVNQWLRGSQPTSSLLRSAGTGSFDQLLVTLVFHPNAAGTVAPTLLNWRQIVDCVPGE